MIVALRYLKAYGIFTRSRVGATLVYLLALVLTFLYDPLASWLLASLVGLLFSTYLVDDSNQDILALEDRGNGRMLQASSRLLREGMRAATQVLYVLAALTLLEWVPLPRGIVVPILLFGNVALSVNSAIDAVTRPHLYATRHGEPPIPPAPEGVN